MVGSHNVIEVWDREPWQAHEPELDASAAEIGPRLAGAGAHRSRDTLIDMTTCTFRCWRAS